MPDAPASVRIWVKGDDFVELSKSSIKLLRWLNKNDLWMYEHDIETQYRKFDYRSFNTLKINKFVDSCVYEEEVPEYDDYGNTVFPQHFRISDNGKAYLESLPKRWLPEFRQWIAVGISLVALVLSIIAIVSE